MSYQAWRIFQLQGSKDELDEIPFTVILTPCHTLRRLSPPFFWTKDFLSPFQSIPWEWCQENAPLSANSQACTPKAAVNSSGILSKWMYNSHAAALIPHGLCRCKRNSRVGNVSLPWRSERPMFKAQQLQAGNSFFTHLDDCSCSRNDQKTKHSGTGTVTTHHQRSGLKWCLTTVTGLQLEEK